ncbi:MAG: hypothetical protein NT154_07500 [Verrucomicrobia bacterium]|nr:hypothetical protein [Verrucomicrobiota bacterium]
MRSALKRFAVGLAVSAAVVFGTGLTANAQITYNFTNGLQGWTQIYRTPVTSTNSLWATYDGWGWMPDDGHLGDGWEVVDTLLGRSPAFTLNGSGDLTFQLIGSKSPMAAPNVAPSEIPEIAMINGGFMGVALRDGDADKYVLSRGLSADNYGNTWTDLSFTAAELAPYANDGKVYTLDFIDYDKLGGPTGGDGWLILAGASIPGVAAAEPPSSFKKILTFGPGAVIDHNALTIAWTAPYGKAVTNLAPTYTVSVLATPDLAYPSGTNRDFTDPKTYTVTAQDGSTSDYLVTVTVPDYPTTVTNYGSLGAVANGSYYGWGTTWNSSPHGMPGALAGSTDTATIFYLQAVAPGRILIPWNAVINPNPPQPFTVECWHYPFTGGGFGTLVHSMLAGDNVLNGNDRSGWNFRAQGADLKFVAGSTNATYTIVTAPGVVQYGTWQHFVAVYDGTNGTLFANGVQVASAAVPLLANFASQTAIGGRGQQYDGWNCDGIIDEVAIYTNVLSSDEILAHYRNGTNATPAIPYNQLILAKNPIAYYRLDEWPVNPLPPVLGFAPNKDGTFTLTWKGAMLLEATSVMGPWTTNTTAVSPLTVTPDPATTEMYYRLQAQ